MSLTHKKDILSPGAQVVNSDQEALDSTFKGYESFVNASMVDTAHPLGLKVKPYTIDRLNTAEQLADLGTDGIITDLVSEGI
jgi:glycerophosphoryl diester phosphodiesterase